MIWEAANDSLLSTDDSEGRAGNRLWFASLARAVLKRRWAGRSPSTSPLGRASPSLVIWVTVRWLLGLRE